MTNAGSVVYVLEEENQYRNYVCGVFSSFLEAEDYVRKLYKELDVIQSLPDLYLVGEARGIKRWRAGVWSWVIVEYKVDSPLWMP